MSVPSSTWSLADLQEIIVRHWGYRTLRPLQDQAMQAVLDGRDSLVVLPTGGGKSLCYQAPAVLRGGTTVVISPLIALMKDQVDSLRACGIAAASIDSSLSAGERFAYEMDVRQGEVRLLFLSPERLVQTDFYRVLQQIDVRTFAIDEAHCISHWGHDFRPEYRQLSRLREFFPQAAVHAYTATATEPVRRDIIAQLALKDPVVLVGSFDRANLIYRILPRHDVVKQTLEVIERHEGDAGIIYCLRRRDVDELAAVLKQKNVKALPYHAGMTGEHRQAAQDAFSSEQVDVIVATVAFGMGIDRSNVRFVLHTAMPKSLEHYQQETGRAGRDGLEAECVLLYSGADVVTFKSMLAKSAQEAGNEAHLPSVFKHLEDMDRYCRGAVCRHRALVRYFGQDHDGDNCNACDLCLGDTEGVPDALIVAQKILSCVARVKQNFGIGQVAAILRGENTDNVRKRGHDKLTTFGLLKGHSKADVRDWVYQLIGQGVLLQVGDEYPLLRLNDASWDVMRGQRQVRLVQLVRRKKGEKPEKARVETTSWEGVDRELFEALRRLRRDLARDRQVSPFIIFTDNTLRELARMRPSTLERMRLIAGVGDKRLRDFGALFLTVIADHCRTHGLSFDVPPGGKP
ncbi:MAG TPA: DNA helicase RecQ [Gemmataceae bacterium]|nr:DNA helicase RecQ [Gemmataceae bacterium]